MKKKSTGLRRLALVLLAVASTLRAGTITVTDSARVDYPTQRMVIVLETYPNSSQTNFIDYDHDSSVFSDVLTADFELKYSLPEGATLNFAYAWADVRTGYSRKSSVQVTRLDPVGTFAAAKIYEPRSQYYDFYDVNYFRGGAGVSTRGGVGLEWPDGVYGGYNSRTVFTYEWETWFTADAYLDVDYTGPQVNAVDTAPEPGTMLLAGVCLMALGWLGAKRGKSCA